MTSERPHGYLLRFRLLLAVAFFVVFAVIYSVIKVFFYEPVANTYAYSDRNYEVLGLSLPGDLNFCGEKLPTNNYGVRRALEKEFFSTAYWKSTSSVLFNKAQRWFPYIEPILRRERIPADFKYLVVIESQLSNSTSGAGAAGFWQLVPFSARQYGLEVNEYVDERYDVEKSTVAACKHIREAFEAFNNWTLAAAAYNRGIGGIQKALNAQKAKSYFDLFLNPETGAFVYRILAYKTLLSRPSHFGINKKLRYFGRPAYKVLKVDSAIGDLAHFAKWQGTNLITLRCFNPWLLRNSLPNPAGKTYQIRIPKNPKADYSGYARDLMPEGDPLTPYVKEPKLAEGINEDTVLTKQVNYVVRVTEPLGNLARFLKVQEEDLRRWNSLPDNAQAVQGQTLTVYYRR
jgi:membrane-bound lytic murein transglycosylase D